MLPDVSLTVSHVPPASVAAVWPTVLPYIARGLRHGEGDTLTADGIRADIEAGNMLLWAVHEGADILAAVILQVAQYPARRSLVVVMLAGRDMPRWVDQVEGLLRDYRDIIGADDISSVSRWGIAKQLKERGWQQRAVVMRLVD